MGILDEDVVRVRETTDFVALASEHIALRRVGRRWVGLCPFHMEKSPSLSINAEDGFFHCFGCQKGGDVITFVRDLEHLDFVEAVEKLAARAGITLRYDERAGHDGQQRTRITEALEAAIDWYHQRLMSGADGAAARAYLRAERGYDGDVVRRYRLGWAPEGWNQLVRSLKVPAATLAEAGLAGAGERGHFDTFRGRLLFPIFEASGRPVGFGGRLLPGGRGPKYKNTAGSAVYDKSRVLYGLNWAKNAVVERQRVVVCEGYTDVIGLHGAGIGEAVATCGTALADGHVRLLTRFARRIVLAYDADGAGQAAAERVYEWEHRFEVDIAVALLPPGADPADVARRDPDALGAAVEGAQPYLAFRLERLLARADLRTPEGRARAAGAAMSLVATHPNALVRDQYVMVVADRCRIDPTRLRQMPPPPGGDERRGSARRSVPVDAAGREAGSRRPEAAADGEEPEPAGATSASVAPAELEGLRLALHRPDEVADRLDEALFGHPVARSAFRALVDATTLHQAMDGADAATAALLQRLVVEEAEAEADDVLVRLVERAGARALATLQADSRRAADPSSLVPTIAWIKLALEDLRAEGEPAPGPQRAAEERLVPWLVAFEADANE
ncbi:MAG TPA: DNA primase [Acidimicrobiales bacterium]|nr:DNA primase [Acidimicrobiales bacterium]